MTSDPDSQFLAAEDLGFEEWNRHALARGWSDGLPLAVPTEAAVRRLVAPVRGANEPFPPIPPRNRVPTLESLAANAVMAGCRPEHFPVVLAALRAVLAPAYNLHGTLATTHPCGQMVLVNGPARAALGINCGSNCLGPGTLANAVIGRALQLVLLNLAGATPGEMDRATQGTPAKYGFCFGENEEASPWAPYHVRRGFAPDESVVTVMAAEAPHNVNDHASRTAEGILTTVAGTLSECGANTVYLRGPTVVVLGPEHAATIHRDGLGIEAIQETLFRRARVHVSRISPENRASFAERGTEPVDDHYHIGGSPADLHVVVAGGPGKHSAVIPSFGSTAASAVRVVAGDP